MTLAKNTLKDYYGSDVELVEVIKEGDIADFLNSKGSSCWGSGSNQESLRRINMMWFTVVLEAVGGHTDGYRYYFICMAENEKHAAEQALDAYPEDVVISVKEGDPE